MSEGEWGACPICGKPRDLPFVACAECWESVPQTDRDRIRAAYWRLSSPRYSSTPHEQRVTQYEDIVKSVFPTYVRAAQR